MANPDVKDSEDFYSYLKNFGMYKPTRKALTLIQELKEQEAWAKLGQYYASYRRKWRGPDVDIYIFPIDTSNSFFMRHLQGRSGLAFQNKIFLFLSPISDEKHWEALMIHEYHHATRMSRNKLNPNKYTLLDSLVFEGLAENAVLEYCGEDYVAYWTNLYQEKRLKYYWNNIYEHQLQLTRKNPAHDNLLFRKKRNPVDDGVCDWI